MWNILFVGKHYYDQQGQSLIESIVAISILVTGLSAGLGLAIFAFGTTGNIVNQITATGLAREGIEVVRYSRDTNWLRGSLTDCSATLGPGQYCYLTWLSTPNTISSNERRAFFRPGNPAPWSLNPGGDFQLYRHITGVFVHESTSQPTDFFRRLFIQNTGQGEILVTSVVWWRGKRCNNINNANTLNNIINGTTCKIVTQERLTNWKNY